MLNDFILRILKMFWKLLEKLNKKKKKNWSPLQKKNMVLVVKNYIKIGIKFLVLSSFASVTHIVPLILSTIESNRNLCDIFHVVFVFFTKRLCFERMAVEIQLIYSFVLPLQAHLISIILRFG